MVTEVFAKTKILCTLGPSTQSADCIKKLMLSGMDGVRLNFSHGNYAFFEGVFDEIHKYGRWKNYLKGAYDD